MMAITWEFLALLVGVVSAPIGIIGTFWWRAEQRRERQEEKHDEKLERLQETLDKGLQQRDVAIQAAHALAQLAHQQLAEFKLKAAETYISKDSTQRMHNDVVDRLGRIEQRLDGLIDRVPQPAPSRRQG